MSDQEEQISNQEEQEDQQQQNEDQEDEEEQEDQDEDQDGEEDQDQEEEEEDQDQQGQEQGQEDQSKQEKVPSFKPVSQQFAFKNLLAEIASIGNNVDHFINSLPSRGGSAYRSYQPRIQLDLKPRTDSYTLPPQQKKYTIMKDQDIQVSMQPQIVIQQTLAPREQPKKQPYKISNESTKFLAQLYEQNKKLKRFQNNQAGTYTNSWYKSKDKFERPQHQRGLINLQDRNKEIDQAIQMLRRQNYDQ